MRYLRRPFVASAIGLGATCFAGGPSPAFAQTRELFQYNNYYAGRAVAVLDDLDGDGVREVLAGAPNDNTGFGAAVVISGRDGSELSRTIGPAKDSYFGEAVEMLPDVDGDGVSDYVVSAPGYKPPGATRPIGWIEVISGASGTELWHLQGFGNDKEWGEQLARVGDVDGDGATDFVVNKNWGGAYQGGRVELYSGKTGASLWIVDGTVRHAEFGFRLRRIPDVDLDGIDEIAASTPGANLAGGTISLLSGATGALLWTVTDPSTDSFGWAMADGGDYDGDGVHDVLAGVPGANNGLGGLRFLSGVDGSLLGSIDGDSSHGYLGNEVGAAFDADGDGDLEVFVNYYDGISKGYLALLDPASGVFLTNVFERSFGAGDSVPVPCGDLDGDGFGDLVVGQVAGFGVKAFAFRSPPVITSVNPTRGGHHGGTAVTILGSGFALANSLQVTLAGVAATNVTVVDDGTIDCVAPATVAGLDDVVVSHDAGSATLAGGFAATPALRVDGDAVVGGTLTLRFLCDAGDDLFVIAGVPPIVSIPTPPFEGALCILPILPLLYAQGWTSDELDLIGSIPNDPSLSGLHFLVQALVGAPLTGAGRNGSWTNCADIAIQ